MANLNRLSDVFLPETEYPPNVNASLQTQFTINDNSILPEFPIPTEIVNNPIGTVTSLSGRFRIEDFPQMDHIDATALVYSEDINRLIVNTNARNFVSGISPTFAKPFITVSCGFEVFDGYLICSSQSWYEVRIEVIHKPSQEVLDLILKIYEGSKWEDRVK